MSPDPIASAPDTTPVFRLATLEEVDAVVALYTAAKAEPYSVWNDEYPTRTNAAADLAAGRLYVLVGDDGVRGALSVVSENECDALSCWRLTGADVREIARVVVRSDCHGQGYAAYMMRCICAILQGAGVRAVHISVAVGNIPARMTYPRVGFATVGEAPLFGGQYLLMEKELFAIENP